MLPTDASPTSQRTILVVDDDPGPSGVLARILQDDGYLVLACESGPEALALVAQAPPDLILLDIDMPEMSGYEVCERLQASDGAKGIPVLFVSGRTRPEDTVAAFRAGGVDYISKPFQPTEVLARVRTHVRLRALQHALAEENERLEAAVAARTRELAEAHKRLATLDRTKDDFLRIISHELRTPLNGVLGITEVVFGDLPPTRDNDELRRAYNESRQRIESLLDEALTLADLDIGNRALPIRAVRVAGVVRRAAELSAGLAQERGATVTAVTDETNTVQGDEEWLVKALHALITATLRLAPVGAALRVWSETGAAPRIVIESAGTVVPEAVIATLFETFLIREADTPGGGVGLGPPMAHRILSLFGAQVEAANHERDRFRFTICWSGGAS